MARFFDVGIWIGGKRCRIRGGSAMAVGATPLVCVGVLRTAKLEAVHNGANLFSLRYNFEQCT